MTMGVLYRLLRVCFCVEAAGVDDLAKSALTTATQSTDLEASASNSGSDDVVESEVDLGVVEEVTVSSPVLVEEVTSKDVGSAAGDSGVMVAGDAADWLSLTARVEPEGACSDDSDAAEVSNSNDQTLVEDTTTTATTTTTTTTSAAAGGDGGYACEVDTAVDAASYHAVPAVAVVPEDRATTTTTTTTKGAEDGPSWPDNDDNSEAFPVTVVPLPKRKPCVDIDTAENEAVVDEDQPSTIDAAATEAGRSSSPIQQREMTTTTTADIAAATTAAAAAAASTAGAASLAIVDNSEEEEESSVSVPLPLRQQHESASTSHEVVDVEVRLGPDKDEMAVDATTPVGTTTTTNRTDPTTTLDTTTTVDIPSTTSVTTTLDAEITTDATTTKDVQLDADNDDDVVIPLPRRRQQSPHVAVLAEGAAVQPNSDSPPPPTSDATAAAAWCVGVPEVASDSSTVIVAVEVGEMVRETERQPPEHASPTAEAEMQAVSDVSDTVGNTEAKLSKDTDDNSVMIPLPRRHHAGEPFIPDTSVTVRNTDTVVIQHGSNTLAPPSADEVTVSDTADVLCVNVPMVASASPARTATLDDAETVLAADTAPLEHQSPADVVVDAEIGVEAKSDTNKNDDDVIVPLPKLRNQSPRDAVLPDASPTVSDDNVVTVQGICESIDTGTITVVCVDVPTDSPAVRVADKEIVQVKQKPLEHVPPTANADIVVDTVTDGLTESRRVGDDEWRCNDVTYPRDAVADSVRVTQASPSVGDTAATERLTDDDDADSQSDDSFAPVIRQQVDDFLDSFNPVRVEVIVSTDQEEVSTGKRLDENDDDDDDVDVDDDDDDDENDEYEKLSQSSDNSDVADTFYFGSTDTVVAAANDDDIIDTHYSNLDRQNGLIIDRIPVASEGADPDEHTTLEATSSADVIVTSRSLDDVRTAAAVPDDDSDRHATSNHHASHDMMTAGIPAENEEQGNSSDDSESHVQNVADDVGTGADDELEVDDVQVHQQDSHDWVSAEVPSVSVPLPHRKDIEVSVIESEQTVEEQTSTDKPVIDRPATDRSVIERSVTSRQATTVETSGNSYSQIVIPACIISNLPQNNKPEIESPPAERIESNQRENAKSESAELKTDQKEGSSRVMAIRQNVERSPQDREKRVESNTDVDAGGRLTDSKNRCAEDTVKHVTQQSQVITSSGQSVKHDDHVSEITTSGHTEFDVPAPRFDATGSNSRTAEQHVTDEKPRSSRLDQVHQQIAVQQTPTVPSQEQKDWRRQGTTESPTTKQFPDDNNNNDDNDDDDRLDQRGVKFARASQLARHFERLSAAAASTTTFKSSTTCHNTSASSGTTTTADATTTVDATASTEATATLDTTATKNIANTTYTMATVSTATKLEPANITNKTDTTTAVHTTTTADTPSTTTTLDREIAAEATTTKDETTITDTTLTTDATTITDTATTKDATTTTDITTTPAKATTTTDVTTIRDAATTADATTAKDTTTTARARAETSNKCVENVRRTASNQLEPTFRPVQAVPLHPQPIDQATATPQSVPARRTSSVQKSVVLIPKSGSQRVSADDQRTPEKTENGGTKKEERPSCDTNENGGTKRGRSTGDSDQLRVGKPATDDDRQRQPTVGGSGVPSGSDITTTTTTTTAIAATAPRSVRRTLSEAGGGAVEPGEVDREAAARESEESARQDESADELARVRANLRSRIVRPASTSRHFSASVKR